MLTQRGFPSSIFGTERPTEVEADRSGGRAGGRIAGNHAEGDDEVADLDGALHDRLVPLERRPDRHVEPVEPAAELGRDGRGRDLAAGSPERGGLRFYQVVAAEELLAGDSLGHEDLRQGAERGLLVTVLDPRQLAFADLGLGAELGQGLPALLAQAPERLPQVLEDLHGAESIRAQAANANVSSFF